MKMKKNNMTGIMVHLLYLAMYIQIAIAIMTITIPILPMIKITLRICTIWF